MQESSLFGAMSLNDRANLVVVAKQTALESASVSKLSTAKNKKKSDDGDKSDFAVSAKEIGLAVFRVLEETPFLMSTPGTVKEVVVIVRFV